MDVRTADSESFSLLGLSEFVIFLQTLWTYASFRYAGQPIMKVEESHESLEDFRDEISEVQEQEEGDEEEYEPEVDETRTRPRSSSAGTGYRKIATIVAIIAILLGLLISTYQHSQSKPKVIFAKRSVKPELD